MMNCVYPPAKTCYGTIIATPSQRLKHIPFSANIFHRMYGTGMVHPGIIHVSGLIFIKSVHLSPGSWSRQQTIPITHSGPVGNVVGVGIKVIIVPMRDNSVYKDCRTTCPVMRKQ